MKTAIRVLVGVGLLAACGLYAAETPYPNRPVRLIVPFPPAGPTDYVARVFAQKLTESSGQQVVVDNRSGAGGNIGMGIAANATPDGYTIIFVSSSFMVNPGLYKTTPYDPYKSFIPVSNLAASPHVFFTHPSQPVKSIADLIDAVKRDPKFGNIATPGIGTVPHLSAHLLAFDAKINIVTVPYAGGGPSIAAVVGNQVAIGCQAVPPVTPHIQAGRVRALAFTSAQRNPLFPDVPTMAEAGFKGHESETISGMLVPAGTPRAVVNRLHAEAVRIMALTDVKSRIADQGFNIIANTPQEFAVVVKREVERWAKVIKDAGISAN